MNGNTRQTFVLRRYGRKVSMAQKRAITAFSHTPVLGAIPAMDAMSVVGMLAAIVESYIR